MDIMMVCRLRLDQLQILVTLYPFQLSSIMELGLTAEYNDPYGESDTIWNYIVIPATWLLPVVINFEYQSVYGSGLTASIGAGNDNWE